MYCGEKKLTYKGAKINRDKSISERKLQKTRDKVKTIIIIFAITKGEKVWILHYKKQDCSHGLQITFHLKKNGTSLFFSIY